MLLHAARCFTAVALSTFALALAVLAAIAPPASAGQANWILQPAPPPPDYPPPDRWTERTLCELSNHAAALVFRTPARIGVAVADLTEGRLWIGGDTQPFALHSVAKVPIAWLTLTAAEARGETLSPQMANQLRQMIAWSRNDAVPVLLAYAGGLPALRNFYAQLGLDGMVAHFHDYRWGRSAGAAADVAATYAQLAISDVIPPAVREQGFALLDGVVPEQRWGATSPPPALRGWSALVKTGQFEIPEEGLRINSAAIWLDQWQYPRYVVAIMSAEHRYWGVGIERSNQIGAALATAIQSREQNTTNPATTCAP